MNKLRVLYQRKAQCSLVLKDRGVMVTGYMKWAETPQTPAQAKFKLIMSRYLVEHEYATKTVWTDNNTLHFMMLKDQPLNPLILLTEIEVYANSLGFCVLDPHTVGLT